MTLFAPLIACMVVQSLTEISTQGMTDGEKVMVESLQGIVSDTSRPIWVETDGIQAQVLQKLKASGLHTQIASGAWSLLSQYRSHVKGVILYRHGQESLNVALSLCGPMRAIALDDQMEQVPSWKSIPVILDVRNLTEKEAYGKFHSRYRKGIVVEQDKAKVGFLGDFTVRHHAFMMDTTDLQFRQKVVQESGKAPLAFGWGKDESGWVSEISKAGGSVVAADWCTNLSTLEALKVNALKPKAQEPVQLKPQERYVAFVMTDGDNLQWLTGKFATDTHWYGTPHRGSFAFTWEVSPLLAQFAPTVFNEIIGNETDKDDFVGGAGSPGYVYPTLSPDRTALAQATRKGLQLSHLKIVSILNANSGSMSDCEPWTALPHVSAVIYKEYYPYHRRHGAVEWFHNKPVVSYRFELWEDQMGIDELARAIESMPINGDGRFGLINVHAWSYDNLGGPMEATSRVIKQLGPQTKVVTATQLIELIKKDHVSHSN